MIIIYLPKTCTTITITQIVLNFGYMDPQGRARLKEPSCFRDPGVAVKGLDLRI